MRIIKNGHRVPYGISKVCHQEDWYALKFPIFIWHKKRYYNIEWGNFQKGWVIYGVIMGVNYHPRQLNLRIWWGDEPLGKQEVMT